MQKHPNIIGLIPQKLVNIIEYKYLNPIPAREGQICPTKPKTLNFGQKYN